MDNGTLDHKVSVLVLSFDGFSELWPPFFDSFFSVWRDCPFQVNLLTNSKSFDHPKVNSLQVGADVSWSDNLIKALSIIQNDYVLLFYEDAFLTGIDETHLKKAIHYCTTNNLDSLLLRLSEFRGKKKVESDIYRVNRAAPYRNSLFVNLIKRTVLLDILKPGENAWQFEIIGNDRSRKYDFYSLSKKIFKYDHAIVKGKWLRATKQKYEKKGYAFQKLNRTFGIIEETIYHVKHKFFNLYISLLPLPLLLFIEKQRSSEKQKYLQPQKQ
jgi:hypothetical protein